MTIVIVRILIAVVGVTSGLLAYFAILDSTAVGLKLGTGIGGGVLAVLTFISWFCDDAAKRIKETAAKTLEEELSAERIRIATATNGAFLPTLNSLQQLATMDLPDRRSELSGFRQEVIDRASDLLQNDAPRIAYFRVENLLAPSRVMRPKPVSQKNRTDEFTTLFDESNPDHAEVWSLIDELDSAVLRTDVDLPGRDYRCFVSAPVRAGGMAFGMLTANTLEAEGLSREDRDNIVVMARMLAAAEGLSLSTTERRSILQVSESRSTMKEEGGAA
ncbi:hypothetical protein [Microbacterium sp. K24]|uniref:hypothetical protein n=1 Tax=Microbacterium sp. K24 TaxID=2305446 RepID=UPI00109CE718|nr:hypothetical protein [Microbacterium sp. K24]